MDTVMDIPALKKMLQDSVVLHASKEHSPLTAQWRVSVVGSDFVNRRFTFSFRAEEDMRNPLGTLHGGMSAGMIDTAMGMTAYCFTRDRQPAFTSELSISYLRPVLLPAALHVTVTVLRAGGHLIFLRADMFSPEAPEQILVSAKGTFYGK